MKNFIMYHSSSRIGRIMTSRQTPTLILIAAWGKNIMSETKNHVLFTIIS
jgi:hypothetical protein